MPLRLIPGAPGARGHRALLLSSLGATPSVAYRPLAGGVAQAASVRAVGSSEVAAALRGFGLQAFGCTVGTLQPGAAYALVASRADEKAETTVRTLAEDRRAALTCVAASCFYAGYRQDAGYLEALRSPIARDASLRLLLGDNLYMDVPSGSTFTVRPMRETIERYVQYWWTSGYADVLSALSSAATWDDHEFWNNYPDAAPHLSRTLPFWRGRYRAAGLACLDALQRPLNPAAAVGAGRSFVLATPLVEFFLLDVRTDRESHSSTASFLAPGTLPALLAWLGAPGVPGVLVTGQPLYAGPGGWLDHALPDYPGPFQAIWRALLQARRSVMLLSGDVHFSRACRLQLVAGSPGSPSREVHEIVTSPASHIPVPLGSRQGSGSVKAPGRVAFAGGVAQLRSDGYLFGTSAESSVAVLRFSDDGAKGVAVRVAFLDLRGNPVRAAASTSCGLEGAPGSLDPVYPTCDVDPLFHLAVPGPA